MLVKGFGETHSLQVSDVPLSFRDLQSMYSAMLDGKQEQMIVDKVISENDLINDDYHIYNIYEWINRDYESYEKSVGRRSFIFHFWKGNLGEKDSAGDGYHLYTDFPAWEGAYVSSESVEQ